MVKMLTNLFSRRGPTATDPVCGMDVDMNNPNGGTAEHEGVTYYFCGKGCRLEFEEDAPAYLSGEKKMEM